MSAHNDIADNLAAKQCLPCTATTPALSQEQANTLLQGLTGWQQQGNAISKNFEFKDYYQTISFVNAIAWVSNREDHHPELTISYRNCHVIYTTHAINALSENDFICAAKIDALLII